MKTKIFDTLASLGLTSIETREVFSHKTRDINELTVWKDKISGVIYIDEFYTGEKTYIEGQYRNDEPVKIGFGKVDYEQHMDTQRRYASHLKFVAGKTVLDFGCGRGDFLRLVQHDCEKVYGIELQQEYVDALVADGISCFTNLDDIDDNSLDICVSFHVIEHLPNPLAILEQLKCKLKKGGTIVIEVPHANDFLLSTLSNESFKDFTLWSQHLVLHTRQSLLKMLASVGFEHINIEGVQRYPLSNHLNWLANAKPGGHKSSLAMIDSPLLTEAYADSLARLDATDTLVAVAKVS